MTNLITNAINHSPKNGDITIDTELNQRNIIVSVKDEGIGIEKNYQQRIFERFYIVKGISKKLFRDLN